MCKEEEEKEEQSFNSLDSVYGEDYLSWKNWLGAESFGFLSKYEHKYYAAEIKKINKAFNSDSVVLEIGFGNGCFLQFAKLNHWKITGIELNEKLVQMAKNNNFDALHSDNLRSFDNNTQDLIVAFDVLEHIPQDKLLGFLLEVKRILKPNGYFMARFPNGDSPFGLSHQNGDVTHVNFIGSGKVRYFANKLAVELVYIGGEARPFLASKNPLIDLSCILKKAMKKIISQFFSTFYARPHYLSANLVIIFKKIG